MCERERGGREEGREGEERNTKRELEGEKNSHVWGLPLKTTSCFDYRD